MSISPKRSLLEASRSANSKRPEERKSDGYPRTLRAKGPGIGGLLPLDEIKLIKKVGIPEPDPRIDVRAIGDQRIEKTPESKVLPPDQKIPKADFDSLGGTHSDVLLSIRVKAQYMCAEQ